MERPGGRSVSTQGFNLEGNLAEYVESIKLAWPAARFASPCDQRGVFREWILTKAVKALG